MHNSEKKKRLDFVHKNCNLEIVIVLLHLNHIIFNLKKAVLERKLLYLPPNIFDIDIF